MVCGSRRWCVGVVGDVGVWGGRQARGVSVFK